MNEANSLPRIDPNTVSRREFLRQSWTMMLGLWAITSCAPPHQLPPAPIPEAPDAAATIIPSTPPATPPPDHVALRDTIRQEAMKQATIETRILQPHQATYSTACNQFISQMNAAFDRSFPNDFETHKRYNFTFAKAYVTNPENIQNDFLNPDVFWDWAEGKPSLPQGPAQTRYTYNPDNPSHRRMHELMADIAAAVAKRDPQRSPSITISDNSSDRRYETHPRTGEMIVNTEALPESDSPFFGTTGTAMHEILHTLTPQTRSIFPTQNHQFYLIPETGTLPTVLTYDTMWMRTMANNFTFMKQRFYDGTGFDILTQFMNGKSMDWVINEISVNLCMDYIFKENIRVPLDQWPEEVASAVKRTLNFVVYGNEANIEQPLPEAEIETIRKNILKIHEDYSQGAK